MSSEFSLPLRVYIEDTDAGGVVYYVNYLKFMERARTEYMRWLGFGKDSIFNRSMMFVVKSVQLDFQKPARLDDELVVTAAVAQLGGASMLMRQCVTRGPQVLVAGTIKIASVDRQTLKPVRLPAEIRGAVRQKTA